jgi:DNA mismatch repair protein MutL
MAAGAGDASRGGGTSPPAVEDDRIAILDPLVADQIAAGEVVERPASVVKELVENSLDAGASEIEVELRDGGREWISVRDDGFGMTAGDARRACLRHATSKLRKLDDLLSIESQGFRGEALASIAAVAEVVLVTRAKGSDVGVRIAVRDGRVGEAEPTGAPVGTTIEVRGLFASLPVRRKFLRAPATETGHITEMLQRLALVRPDVGFACRQGGRDLLRHPRVARSEERLRQVLGAERSRTMLPCEARDGEIAVRGFVSPPGESVAQARSTLTWVNRRLVRDRLLLRAILDAYRGVLPQGRYPIAVLEIDLPGSLVDVNVHPTKSEVRFARGDAVYSIVLRAVRSTLVAGTVAQSAGTGRGAVLVAGLPPAGAPVRGAPAATTVVSGGPARVEEALFRYSVRSPATVRPDGVRAWGGSAPASAAVAGREAPAGLAGASGGASVESLPESAPAAPFGALRVVGQAFQTYIVCEASDRLVLVDQHAAHERVRFERLRRADRAPGGSLPPAQGLLVPRAFEFDAATCARLLDLAPILGAAGFEIERFGDRSLLVRSLPAALDAATDPEVLLAEFAGDMLEIGASDRLEAARDALLARIACHGAVRAGAQLPREAMAAILSDLDTIPYAATCPHGRPVMIEWSRGEIARGVRRN